MNRNEPDVVPKNMKTVISIFTFLALTLVSNAGIIGWLTSETRDWSFIQKSGGIRISAPTQKDGKYLLPVDYLPEGNSGLATRKIHLKRKGTQLVLRVVTQLAEKDSNTSRTHYVVLSNIPPGLYEVYYETAGDPSKHLGNIEIK